MFLWNCNPWKYSSNFFVTFNLSVLGKRAKELFTALDPVNIFIFISDFLICKNNVVNYFHDLNLQTGKGVITVDDFIKGRIYIFINEVFYN